MFVPLRLLLSDGLNRWADFEPPIIGQQKKPFRHTVMGFAGFFRLAGLGKV
jgi:hypothetical protein